MITFNDHTAGTATMTVKAIDQKPDGTFDWTIDLVTRIEKASDQLEMLSDHIEADMPGAIEHHRRAQDRIASAKTSVSLYEADVLVSLRLSDENGTVIMDTKSGKVMSLNYSASEKRETYKARLRLFNVDLLESQQMLEAVDRQVFVRSKQVEKPAPAEPQGAQV